MSSDRQKAIVAVLIAILTACAAIIAQLQSEAGDRDDRAGRDAKTYSLEAFGNRVRGDARTNYDYYGAYGQYRELEVLRQLAEERQDSKAARKYEEMRDTLMDTSPLLSGKDPGGKRYFDPTSKDAPDTEPDVGRYEADTFVVGVERTLQMYKAASFVKDAWDNKANTYVVHLTLLAVSLFLLGLAGTIATDATRVIFVVLGIAISVVAVGWAAKTWAEPVPDRRKAGDAIEQYAQAEGLMWQDRDKEAIPLLDKAVAASPDFADAYLERGRAYLNLDPPDYTKALADLRKGAELDPSVEGIFLNLAWCQYNLGDFATSIESCNQGIAARPNDVALQLQRALSTLASGDVDGARKAYTAVEEAAAKLAEQAAARKQEIASDVLADLESGSDDLASLYGTVNDKKGLPPFDKIKSPDAVGKAADVIGDELVSWSLALENTGKPPAGKLTATIDNLEFIDTGVDPAEPARNDTFADRPYQVGLSFDYGGMKNGQTVTYRVWLDGNELDSWRYSEKWEEGPEGTYQTDLYPGYSEAFKFDPGAYHVEIYVDYHLAGYGNFTVKEEE